MIDREALLEAIEKQLISLSVGGCTCGTKSPQVSWHDAGCHYRKSEEILENVEELRTALASQEGAQAGEVVAWICNGEGYDWKKTGVIVTDPNDAKEKMAAPAFWKCRPLTYADTTPPAPDEAVEAEREACALEALMVGSRIASHQGRAVARLCAKAIRARSRSAKGAA